VAGVDRLLTGPAAERQRHNFQEIEMTRRTLSDKGVAALKPRAQRYTMPDPELRGHYVRIEVSGSKSYWAAARNPTSRQIWHRVGAADVLSVEQARALAREIIRRVREGLPPVEPPRPAPQTFQAVAESWLARHVRAKGLRSEREWTRMLERHVYPAWGEREFTEIRRADVTALLDEIEDQYGETQADQVLAVIRAIMNWQAGRIDDYVPPIVKAIRRYKPKEHERARILSDNELRAVWAAAAEAVCSNKQTEEVGTNVSTAFGALVRLLLLTAQRKDKVASMRWEDLNFPTVGNPTVVWTIATAPREKGNAGELLLPPMAVAIIESMPRFVSNPYVLAASRGTGPLNNFVKDKAAFDRKLGAEISTPWVLHDLRRTARSLMSRAGVLPHIAERVLGHVQGGVAGVYDRHEYADEKALALQKLAALIESLVRPRENVVPIRR
jgi:integrase